jgi:hypothetical protein
VIVNMHGRTTIKIDRCPAKGSVNRTETKYCLKGKRWKFLFRYLAQKEADDSRTSDTHLLNENRVLYMYIHIFWEICFINFPKANKNYFRIESSSNFCNILPLFHSLCVNTNQTTDIYSPYDVKNSLHISVDTLIKHYIELMRVTILKIIFRGNIYIYFLGI